MNRFYYFRLFSDFLTICISILFLRIILFDQFNIGSTILIISPLIFFWYFSARILNYYDEFLERKYSKEFVNTFNVNILTFLLYFSFLFFIDDISNVPKRLFIYFFITIQIFLVIQKNLIRKFIKSSSPRIDIYTTLVIIGKAKYVKQLINEFNGSNAFQYEIKGYFSDRIVDGYENFYLGGLANYQQSFLNNEFKELAIIPQDLDLDYIDKLIINAEKNGIRIKLVPDLLHFYAKYQNWSFIGNLPVLSLRAEPLQNLFNRIIKRAFDVSFSLTVLLFLFPILLPILGILIKLDSKGPIFFKQLRSGKDNSSFWCYKFRTMRVNIESDLIQAQKNDPRVTRLGSFLRKSSLDELPQFFNVLIGNMSVVGPRPHMLKHTEDYSKLVDKYMVRHFVKPGLTGWAQVNGYRGEIKSIDDLRLRVQNDIWYLENWNISLDFQIILQTFINILKGSEMAY